MHFLAANALARALFADLFDGQERPNSARFIFLDHRARDLYPEWAAVARDVVAALRSAAGRSPDDRALTEGLGVESDSDLTIYAYTTEPGTRSAGALSLLG